jgi:carbonic anhydrase/acetyltransferase-like protein (isoleucine patch superfamily)
VTHENGSKSLNPNHLSFHGTTPSVADDAYIAANATLIGAVDIRADASIWFGAVLRADGDSITIGAGSNVQDGCVIHADPGLPVHIGHGVTLGHRAIVHGATIHDNVIIGMGAIILNGANIGDWSIVAAGAVVREGHIVPAGSLVAGVPGKVIRQVDDEAREHIRRNAQHYVTAATTYRTAT